jgi:hypothetical protein
MPSRVYACRTVCFSYFFFSADKLTNTGQEILAFYGKKKWVHYRVHNSPSSGLIMSQIKPVYSSIMEQLTVALRYKPEGCGCDFR